MVVTLSLMFKCRSREDADALILLIASDHRVLTAEGTITEPVPMIVDENAARRMAADDVRLRAEGKLPPLTPADEYALHAGRRDFA